jgi:hypothetical protein
MHLPVRMVPRSHAELNPFLDCNGDLLASSVRRRDPLRRRTRICRLRRQPGEGWFAWILPTSSAVQRGALERLAGVGGCCRNVQSHATAHVDAWPYCALCAEPHGTYDQFTGPPDWSLHWTSTSPPEGSCPDTGGRVGRPQRARGMITRIAPARRGRTGGTATASPTAAPGRRARPGARRAPGKHQALVDEHRDGGLVAHLGGPSTGPAARRVRRVRTRLSKTTPVGFLHPVGVYCVRGCALTAVARGRKAVRLHPAAECRHAAVELLSKRVSSSKRCVRRGRHETTPARPPPFPRSAREEAGCSR